MEHEETQIRPKLSHQKTNIMSAKEFEFPDHRLNQRHTDIRNNNGFQTSSNRTSNNHRPTFSVNHKRSSSANLDYREHTQVLKQKINKLIQDNSKLKSYLQAFQCCLTRLPHLLVNTLNLQNTPMQLPKISSNFELNRKLESHENDIIQIVKNATKQKFQKNEQDLKKFRTRQLSLESTNQKLTDKYLKYKNLAISLRQRLEQFESMQEIKKKVAQSKQLMSCYEKTCKTIPDMENEVVEMGNKEDK